MDLQEKRVREEVLAIVQESKGPLTNHAIYKAIQGDGGSPEYGTVCKLLNELVENGILERTKEGFPDSPWYLYNTPSED